VCFFKELSLVGTSSGGIRFSKSGYSYLWGQKPTSGADDILAFADSRGKASVKFLAGGFGGGVRVSSDSGKSWMSSNNGLVNMNITSHASGQTPQDSTGQIILAGTYGDGLYASTDNGQNWMPKNQSLSALQINAMEVAGGLLYMGTHQGIIRSCD